MNIDELKQSKEGVLTNFSPFRAATHILKVYFAEMAGGIPRQCANRNC